VVSLRLADTSCGSLPSCLCRGYQTGISPRNACARRLHPGDTVVCFCVVSRNARDGPHPNTRTGVCVLVTDRGLLRRGRTARRGWSTHARSGLRPSLGSQDIICGANRHLMWGEVSATLSVTAAGEAPAGQRPVTPTTAAPGTSRSSRCVGCHKGEDHGGLKQPKVITNVEAHVPSRARRPCDVSVYTTTRSPTRETTAVLQSRVVTGSSMHGRVARS
jgi:hypothetical protein